MGLICSVTLKRPAHKEQHLCADKAYDSDDLREFSASASYEAHIKVNPRAVCRSSVPHARIVA